MSNFQLFFNYLHIHFSLHSGSVLCLHIKHLLLHEVASIYKVFYCFLQAWKFTVLFIGILILLKIRYFSEKKMKICIPIWWWSPLPWLPLLFYILKLNARFINHLSPTTLKIVILGKWTLWVPSPGQSPWRAGYLGGELGRNWSKSFQAWIGIEMGRLAEMWERGWGYLHEATKAFWSNFCGLW